jgi:hypothetical protein
VDRKFKCPMMCGMPMMNMMAPKHMMPGMVMGEGPDLEHFYEDEEDDRQCVKMYSETSRKMMVYVKVEVDRMEQKDDMMHEYPLDRDMVNAMTENAYRAMVKDMPEMAEEESRQYPAGRFARDLLGVLLLNELFRRRRRHRRRRPYGYPFGRYDYDYESYEDFDNDFDFYDYD